MVFLRRVDPQRILNLIREHQVTHLCGAPIVLNALVNMPDSAKAAIDHPVNAMVAGAAPPAKVIGAVEEMGNQGNPRLRPDRSVRPGDPVRLALGMG